MAAGWLKPTSPEHAPHPIGGLANFITTSFADTSLTGIACDCRITSDFVTIAVIIGWIRLQSMKSESHGLQRMPHCPRNGTPFPSQRNGLLAMIKRGLCSNCFTLRFKRCGDDGGSQARSINTDAGGGGDRLPGTSSPLATKYCVGELGHPQDALQPADTRFPDAEVDEVAERDVGARLSSDALLHLPPNILPCAWASAEVGEVGWG